MYKRIVVAIDGSKTSDHALDEAVKLAAETGATLVLLHVSEDFPVIWEPEGISIMSSQEFMKAIADAGRALLAKYQQSLVDKGITVETELVESAGGRLGSVITTQAATLRGDLLVIGTHGHKGIEHLLMGSVAEGVIRTATMPVLLVRSK